MKRFALTALSLCGCLGLPPPPGFGTTGPATSKQAEQTCDPVQQDTLGKTTVEGQWQDWGGTNKVYTFKDGAVTVTKWDDAGKPVNEATGKYTVANDRDLAVTWDDGQAEHASVYIDNSPGCEMMSVYDRSSGSRLPESQESLERVNCHFEGATADNTTTTPVTR